MSLNPLDQAKARNILGDELSCTIELKARKDADANSFDPPGVVDGEWMGETYWEKAQNAMRYLVYQAQFEKRSLRNMRKTS